MKLSLFCLLTLVSATAMPADAPVSEAIYKCYRTHYDPPVCQKVAGTIERPNLAELLAATQAARTGKTIRVTRLLLGGTVTSVSAPVTDPITECGNGHGRSACCRIIGEVDDILYIECG